MKPRVPSAGVRRVCVAIVRGDAILLVRHEHDGRSYWTLPGGGVEADETPEQAVLREVREEVELDGRVGARLFDIEGERGREVCFAVEVDPDTQPRLGFDPELAKDAQMLAAVAWHPLADMAEDVQVARVIGSLSRSR